ncbi:MAG: InlB B-repeat-containing protein [Olegusella sp.]|nr:InlB B-repeat-containing protein [Olegusella sp.]
MRHYGIKHRGGALAVLFAVLMAFAMVPRSAFAEGDVAWIGNQGYPTLEAAVNAAPAGQTTTITLGEGKYTLYNKGADTKGKDLVFVGQGTDKTAWGIGATVPDPSKFGTEYNGDYSFDGAGTITFKDMTLQSGTVDYLGFIRADNTVVENCVVNGKTFYWGYKTATFKDTTFNAPKGDYAIWTYSSPTMTFERCTFNSSGKTINVYTDFSAGKHNITINYSNNTVNSTASKKSVMNINDSNMGSYKYKINITGTNKVDGIDLTTDSYKSSSYIDTCSRLFSYSSAKNSTGRTDVTMDSTLVWTGGKKVNHEVDGASGKLYTDGYVDDAYDVTTGEWEKQADGSYKRTITKVCKYCGETVTKVETAHTVSYDLAGGTLAEDTSDAMVIDGSTVTVKGAPTKAGYVFKGWSVATTADSPSGIVDGSFVMPSADVKLTAVWEPEPTTPDQPDTPDTPVVPDNPDTPVTPTEPKAPAKPKPAPKKVKTTKAALPATGDANEPAVTGVLLLTGCAAIAGSAALRKKER